MVNDGQRHDVRMAVLEARLNHFEEMTDRKLDEVKTIILDAQKAWKDDKEKSDKEKQAETDRKSAREWSMILAFLVAGIGFIANTAHSLIQMAVK